MLNFDPHRWLDEHGRAPQARSLAGLATLAAEPFENEKADHGFTAAKVAKAANPIAWRPALDALDRDTPLHGLDGQRWRELLRDADWLFEQFAAAAAADGWSAADLFGILPGHDGWGGIADRLRGSRSLVMTPDIARWRRCFTGTPDSFARGASEMPKLVLLWDQITGTKGGIEHA